MKPVITRHAGKHAILAARPEQKVIHLTKQLFEELHFESSIKPRHYQIWIDREIGRIGIEVVYESTPYSRCISVLPSGGFQFGVGKVLAEMELSIKEGNYPLRWEFNRNGFPHLVMYVPGVNRNSLYETLADATVVRDLQYREGLSKCCGKPIEEGGKPEFKPRPGQPLIYTSYPKCSACKRACGVEVIKIVECDDGN